MKRNLSFKEFDNYIVYPDSRVFSKKKGIFLTPILGKGRSKYYSVKVPKRVKLHRLIAGLFIPNPHNHAEVNHKDGNKLNNAHWNLEWCTRLENMQHAYSTGLKNNSGENSGRAKLSAVDVGIVRDALAAGFGNTEIAKYFGVSAQSIWYIKTGRTWVSQ